jgi:hypothetical protein
MTSSHRRFIFVVGVLLLVGAVGATPAGAWSDRITRSEAKAILRTFTPGEYQASIRPYEGSPYDGAHFCALDWHVILSTYLVGGDASFSRDDAQAAVDAVSVSFVLDGRSLASQRTPLKAYPNPSEFGYVNAYYVQDGRVMAPADLAIGLHSLSMTLTEPAGTTTSTISFTIDAGGTGACL